MADGGMAEELINQLEKGDIAIATFLDQSKAFDCINRKLLLQILERYGVRGVAQDIIKSYLTNRKQYVSILDESEEHESTLTEIRHGVPQGSILGPFLFIIYINHLIEKNYVYADDTTCLKTDKDFRQLEKDTEEEVNILTQNLAAYNLKVNPKKTALMVFNPKKTGVPKPDITIYGNKIDQVDSIKFLGIYLDNELKWNKHAQELAKGVASALFALRNIAEISDENVAISVYYALIHSRIKYGIELWGACKQEHFEEVFRLQKKAIRYIKKLSKMEHCKEHFKKLGILTVPGIYIMELCMLVKKNLESMPKLGDRHNYQTRNRGAAEIPVHKTKRYETKPSYRGLIYFEKLPNDIKDIDNIGKFKLALKKYFTEKAFYTINDFMLRQ